MDNFKLHQQALIMSDVHSSYNIARRYLEAAEELDNLKQKYEDLNKITEDLLKTNKVLQDAVDRLKQQIEEYDLQSKADDWRIQYELEC